ncbi:hypothetical protein MKX01_039343, partial [Papaver californicum]
MKLAIFVSFFLLGSFVSTDASTSHVVGGAKGWDIVVSFSTWDDSESAFLAGDTL